MAPDGQLFEEYGKAVLYTEDLLLSSTNGLDASVSDSDGLQATAQNLVKEIKYGITDYAVNGSVSKAITTFDPQTLQYTISSAKAGNDVIDAPYLKGEISRFSDVFVAQQDSVFSHEGNYYLVTDPQSFDDNFLSNLDQIDRSGGGMFFLGKNLPQEAKELIFQDGDSISGKKGITFSALILTRMEIQLVNIL